MGVGVGEQSSLRCLPLISLKVEQAWKTEEQKFQHKAALGTTKRVGPQHNVETGKSL